jgi:hypothetical protein
MENNILQKDIPIPDSLEVGDVSDGYHTFDELYEFRKAYNALLFNQWHERDLYSVHKSLRHHDGELCFGGGSFIVVAMTPYGQISNHYNVRDWELFRVPEEEKALFEYDGHTSADVLERLLKLTWVLFECDNQTSADVLERLLKLTKD